MRSTVIASSRATIRARGLYERYLAGLDDAQRIDLDAMVAGPWTPLAVAMTHYAACDRLALSATEAGSFGAQVASHAFSTSLLAVKNLAIGSGLTPWTAIGQYDRHYCRAFDGGAFRIERLGPKDAILTVTRFPLARFAYFRSAYTGLQHAVIGLFCARSYVRLVPSATGADTFALRAAWV